jgi:hypothetical protein
MPWVEFHEEFAVEEMNFWRSARGAEKGLVEVLIKRVWKWRRLERRKGQSAHMGFAAGKDWQAGVIGGIRRHI